MEVIPSELLVGTKYLGEWQTRVQKLIDAAKAPRRVALVMPSVQDILEVGSSNSQDISVSSMLMPLVERGDLVVIGEADGEVLQGRQPVAIVPSPLRVVRADAGVDRSNPEACLARGRRTRAHGSPDRGAGLPSRSWTFST